MLDLRAHLPQMGGDGGERDARGVQFGGDGQLPRAGHRVHVGAARYGLQDAQFDGLGECRFVEPRPVRCAAERVVQLLDADTGRLLLAPGPVDLGGQPENPAEVPSGIPGFQEFLDAGEGVAAFQQVGDLPQSREVGVAVDVGAAPALRAGQQTAVLVGADGPDGGTAEAGQVLDAVLRLRLVGQGGAPHRSAAPPTAPAAARTTVAAPAGRRPCNAPPCEGWYGRPARPRIAPAAGPG